MASSVGRRSGLSSASCSPRRHEERGREDDHCGSHRGPRPECFAAQDRPNDERQESGPEQTERNQNVAVRQATTAASVFCRAGRTSVVLQRDHTQSHRQRVGGGRLRTLSRLQWIPLRWRKGSAACLLTVRRADLSETFVVANESPQGAAIDLRSGPSFFATYSAGVVDIRSRVSCRRVDRDHPDRGEARWGYCDASEAALGARRARRWDSARRPAVLFH
jgi:hypothetical protein